MKKGIKEIIMFALGASIGSTVSWYITKKKVSEKDEKRRVADLASMKEYVDRLRAKDEAGELASVLDYVSSEETDAPVSESIRSRKEGVSSKSTEKPDFVDYTSYYKEVEESMAASEHPRDDSEAMTSERMDELDNFVEGYNKSMAANSKSLKPKVISADEWGSPEYDHHDHVTLYFYVEDQILTEETEGIERTEELVTDPSSLLGDTLLSSGFTQNDEEVLYVRNISRGTDYIIEKVFDSYENA